MSLRRPEVEPPTQGAFNTIWKFGQRVLKKLNPKPVVDVLQNWVLKPIFNYWKEAENTNQKQPLKKPVDKPSKTSKDASKRLKSLAKRIIDEGPQILKQISQRESETKHGRRMITFTLFEGLDTNLTDKIMEKLKEHVNTSFYLKHASHYYLKNIETDKTMQWFSNNGSPNFEGLNLAEVWLNEREEVRLDNIENRPNTKWQFSRFIRLQISVVATNQPLLGGD